MQFDTEFKKAISNLSSTEKDKLIFRLLKHDLVLANQLIFELLDDENVDEKRAKMQKRIIAEVKQMTDRFYSVGYLVMDLRYLSGEITQHVKITKDKFGEPYLNLIMLTEVLKKNTKALQAITKTKSHSFCIYIIARAFKIILLIKALNEDYFIEFKENLLLLGKLIANNDNLMDAAIHNGFDVNWLLQENIPNDIAKIHKSIRERGYLK